MSAPTESPADLDLPSTDTSPACDCKCHRGGDVPSAVVRVKAHGSRVRDMYACGDYSLLRCEECFEDFREKTERIIALTRGRGRCAGCGRHLLRLSDVILAVIRL